MPLFRFHRGSLEDSLKTTIIVRNQQELRDAIIDNWQMWKDNPAAMSNFCAFKIQVFIPFGISLEKSFDPRCGWYTHYVSTDIFVPGQFCIEGFLSEPMWIYDDAEGNAPEGHICLTKDMQG